MSIGIHRAACAISISEFSRIARLHCIAQKDKQARCRAREFPPAWAASTLWLRPETAGPATEFAARSASPLPVSGVKSGGPRSRRLLPPSARNAGSAEASEAVQGLESDALPAPCIGALCLQQLLCAPHAQPSFPSTSRLCRCPPSGSFTVTTSSIEKPSYPISQSTSATGA